MGTRADAVRVLVIAEDPLARGGIAAMLAGRGPIEIVGLLGPRDGLDGAIHTHRPHVVLWDLGFSDPPDLDGLRHVARREVPLLAIVPEGANAAAVLDAGARGLVLRDGDGHRLAAALAGVAEGLIVMDPAHRESAAMPRPSGAEALVEPLTPREAEVLGLLAQGLTNKTIADRLGISEHTAKFHVNAILGKLGAESRTEAIVHAVRMGLVVL